MAQVLIGSPSYNQPFTRYIEYFFIMAQALESHHVLVNTKLEAPIKSTFISNHSLTPLQGVLVFYHTSTGDVVMSSLK